jgi:3-hydroxyacyl-[acyl-carrier-protein] dehydratase
MTRAEIEAAIPHRPPMLLVDEIIGIDDTNIVGRKTFHGSEFFVQGHYPERPIVPGVILCESALQTGAVLLSRFGGSGIPVVTRINDVRFRKPVVPGDTVENHVALVERLSSAYFMKARIVRDSQVVAQFEFACTLAAEL